MTISPITQQIVLQIERFSPEQQQRVLDFVRSLVRPVGRSGQEVLHLAGGISPEDLEIMRQVADEECEGIDPDGW